MIYTASMPSTIGTIQIAATEKGLCMLTFRFDSDRFYEQLAVLLPGKPIVEKENGHIEAAKAQLEKYFKGELKEFDLSLDLVGTEFQKKVWQELCKIPYGCLYTYGDIADRLGGKNYSRAVGTANKRNPIPIIVPCHRVIREGRRISNYSGGLEVQRALFEVEGIKYNDIVYINRTESLV